MIELPPLPEKPFGYVREEKNRGVPLEDGMVLAVDRALFDGVQMRAYGEACARAALEAAARECERISGYTGGHGLPAPPSPEECAESIRALKS